MKGEKFTHLQKLIQEQLQAGHIEPSSSPWKTPILVIPKKSVKWRLFKDLREINKVIHLWDLYSQEFLHLLLSLYIGSL